MINCGNLPNVDESARWFYVSRNMLQDEFLRATIGADMAENGPTFGKVSANMWQFQRVKVAILPAVPNCLRFVRS